MFLHSYIIIFLNDIRETIKKYHLRASYLFIYFLTWKALGIEKNIKKNDFFYVLFHCKYIYIYIYIYI